MGRGLKVASLFCGCGGTDLGMIGGFEYLGRKYSRNRLELVFANDIDESACAIFNLNFPIKSVQKDVRSIDTNDIPDHDILTGGFPCQSFSIVAQNPPRLGYTSENGKLFFEMVRILERKQPLCFIAENVKGILSANRGRAFPLILDQFRRAGYVVDYKLLNAAAFGIPQKRERVFIVGFRNDLNITPTFPDLVGVTVPLKTVLFATRNIPKKYYFSKKAVNGLMRAKPEMNKGRAQDPDLPCGTVGSHLAKVSLNSTDPVLKIGNKYRRFTPREVARIQSFPDTFKLEGSDAKQYRALGNAIPPVLMWHLTREVIKNIKKLEKRGIIRR